MCRIRAVATEADGACEQVALGAATLADEALAAVGTFVHGLRHDRSTTLELVTKLLEVGHIGAVTQAEGELLMGARAIACAA